MMSGSQGHSTTSVRAHVVSDLLTLVSKKNDVKDYEKIFTDSELDKEQQERIIRQGGKLELCV